MSESYERSNVDDVREVKELYRNLEKRVGKAETIIAQTDIKINNLTTMVNENNKTLKELNNTILELNYFLKSNKQEVENNKEFIRKIEDDFKIIKSEIINIEDKGKFDIIAFIKKNFITFIIVCGFIFYYIKNTFNV